MTRWLELVRLLLAVLVLVGVSGCGTSDPQKLLAKAQEYRQKNEFQAAIIEVKNVLQNDPENGEARYWLGVLYNDIGDFRSGEQELRRALERQYDRNKVVAALGRSLVMSGQFQKALDEMKIEGEAAAPLQAEVLTLRAAAMVGLGRRRDGRDLLEQALGKQPEFAEALVWQTRLAMGEGNASEAARLVERAIASAPRNLDAWLLKGHLARLSADNAAAATAYQKAIELRPDSIAPRINMVSLQLATGKFDDARKQIEQMRKIAPNNPMSRFMLALLEFRQKNYPAARDAVQQVLKVAPNHNPSVLLAGAIELALGSHGQAQAHLRRVLEQTPGNLYARSLMVTSLMKTGQVQRASEMLQAGLKQAPDNTALLTLAGEVSMHSNDFAKASEYFDRAAKNDPKGTTARTKLAISQLAGGETERGLAELESITQVEGGDQQADTILVLTYLRQARYDEALKAAETLEKKQPDNPLTYNLKAAIYLGKKDVANARKQLERALVLRPTYVPAATNLARLDLQEKNPQAARRRLEGVLEKDQNNVAALLALAEFGPGIGATPKEQLDWLERARKASPRTVPPLLALARYYARAGDSKKSLEFAQQAQALGSDNPQVLESLGAAQIAAGERSQAVGTFSKLVELQPKSPVALHRLAGAQSANGDDGAAATNLRKALALKPDFLEAQISLAVLEARARRFPEAMKIARQMQKQPTNATYGHIVEGDILMAEKKHLQAAKAYETAYGMGKSGLLAIKLHGAYTLAGRPKEADARLAQWLKDSPNDVSARLYLAEANLRTSRYKEAIEQYEWVREKQPDNVMVLNNLAWAYHNVKDARALETAERAYKLKPDYGAIGDTLGWILVEQGNIKRGLEILQKAVTAAPKAPDIRFHLAQAWLKSGDKAKARTELETLLAGGTAFAQRAEAEKLLEQLRK